MSGTYGGPTISERDQAWLWATFGKFGWQPNEYERLLQIATIGRAFATVIIQTTTPTGVGRDEALKHVQEAMMWAGTAVRNEPFAKLPIVDAILKLEEQTDG